MIKNIINSAAEYMAMGFSANEVPMITRHDILFNKYVDGIITNEEKKEMFNLAKMLEL